MREGNGAAHAARESSEDGGDAEGGAGMDVDGEHFAGEREEERSPAGEGAAVEDLYEGSEDADMLLYHEGGMGAWG